MSEQSKLAGNIVSEMAKNNDTITLIVREGQAAPVELPEPLKIVGTLSSVKAWAENPGKKKAIDADKAVLTINTERMSAVFALDPTDKRAGTITGEAEFSDDFKELKINAGPVKGSFRQNELESLLKRKRALFPDLSQHAQLLSAVVDFRATTTGNVQSGHNNRGGHNVQYIKDVKADAVPLSAKMKFAILKGEEAREFMMDICFDMVENQVVFWFESMQVEDLRRGVVEDLLKGIAETYEKLGVVIVRQ